MDKPCGDYSVTSSERLITIAQIPCNTKFFTFNVDPRGYREKRLKQSTNVQIAIKHIVLGDSINEIAKMLGYESSSAFIYMFKKQVGVTPNNYLNIC